MKSHVETMEEIFSQLRSLVDAASALTGGNRDPDRSYHLKKVGFWFRYALRSTGFKVGEKARLARDVPCEGAWKGDEQNLCAGKEGVVEDIDIEEDGQIRVLFTPDAQTWIPSETYESQGIFAGVPKPVNRPHCFWLKAEHFVKPPAKEKQNGI